MCKIKNAKKPASLPLRKRYGLLNKRLQFPEKIGGGTGDDAIRFDAAA